MKTNTTIKDFNEYKKWVSFYLNKFGLNDWTVYYAHKELRGSVAEVDIDTVARGATFSLNKNNNSGDIKGDARHEVCHLLIADLSHLSGSYCTEEQHKQVDEALVCRLTNLLQ